MINGKVQVISDRSPGELTRSVNNFLSKIDIRQIIKIQYSSSYGQSSDLHSCMILYVNKEDIRDSKIDTVFDK